MPTSTLTDFVSAHAMLLKVTLGCLAGPLLVLLSLALWYMTRTSISRRRTVSDIEVNIKESTSGASDIFPTPIDSLKSYPSLYFGPSAAVSHPNSSPPPPPPPLSLWQAADEIVCPYPRPRPNFSSSQVGTSESYSPTDSLARPPPAPPLYADVIVPYNHQVALCGGSNSMAYGYRKPDCVDYARPRARRNARPATTIPPLLIVKKGSNTGLSSRRASKPDGMSASSPSVKRKETTAQPSTLNSEIPGSILPFVDKDLPPAPLLLVDKAPALPSVSITESSSPSPDVQKQESTCRPLSGVPKFRSIVPFVDEENLMSRPLLSVGANTAKTRHLSMEIVRSSLRTAGKENTPPLNIVTSKRTSTPPLSVTNNKKKKKKKKNPATETMTLCDVTNTKKSWEVFRARGAIRKELGLPCLVRNDGEEILGTILE